MLTVEDIQRAVCEHFSVSLADLHGTGRKKTIVQARQVAMYLCRARLNHSYSEIAEAFGGRDHTTVMSAVKRTRERMEHYPEVADQVVTIRLRLDRLPAESKPPPAKGQTIMKIRNDAGVMEYAIGLSKDDAQFLIWMLFGRQAPRIEAINKKLDWVIETAERDERWARERAAGEESNV